jgi:hypothetical protein
MQQHIVNKLLAAGVIVIGLIFVVNALASRKNADAPHARDSLQATKSEPRAEPITKARMRQKILQTGWDSLTPEEKRWVRDLYITDMTRIDRALTYRLRSARIRGLTRIAQEIADAQAQLREEGTRIESDPDADPTTAQTLINQILEALNKP